MEEQREVGVPSKTIDALLGRRDPDYILLEVPDDLVAPPSLSNTERILGESVWRPSKYTDYWYRVDPARSDMHLMRHIHIAHQKHINSTTKQVSWADIGQRHDRHNFDDKFKGMPTARLIAREVLKAPDSVVFERSTLAQEFGILNEQVEEDLPSSLYAVCFRVVLESK